MDGDDLKPSTEGDGGNQSTAAPAQPAPANELREDQIQNAVSFLSHPKVRPRSMPRVLAVLKIL
jgi:hypothetical protein